MIEFAKIILIWIIMVIMVCMLFIFFFHFCVGISWEIILSPKFAWR